MTTPTAEDETPNWPELVAAAAPTKRPFVTAHTFGKKFGTASQPARLDCDDSRQYVVKALRTDTQQGRMLFNDQVVARAGALMGAPVPIVALVEVPKALIDVNAEMSHFKPGLAHGSRWIEDVSERVDGINSADTNKERFGLLSVLYGLMHCADRQFIYSNAPPHEVYSHDHGHFFPNGPDWTVASLNSAADPVLDNELITAAGLSSVEVGEACARLKKLTDAKIAALVAFPPDEWNVPPADRAALAGFIAKRRDALLKAHPKSAN